VLCGLPCLAGERELNATVCKCHSGACHYKAIHAEATMECPYGCEDRQKGKNGGLEYGGNVVKWYLRSDDYIMNISNMQVSDFNRMGIK
jgi:hypothetical protein